MLDKNELYKSLFNRVRERLQQEVNEHGMLVNKNLQETNKLDGIQLNENLR